MKRTERIKNQGKELDSLLELHRQWPELPVVPMVDSDVISDDAAYSRNWYMGRWGKASIQRLFAGNKRVHEYDPDPNETELIETLEDAPLASGDLERAEEERYYALKLYYGLSWERCIVVNIDTA